MISIKRGLFNWYNPEKYLTVTINLNCKNKTKLPHSSFQPVRELLDSLPSVSACLMLSLELIKNSHAHCGMFEFCIVTV